MTGYDFIDDMPEDDELAFCHLEGEFRKDRDQTISETDSSQAYFLAQATYMNRVMAAARELDVLEFVDWELPKKPDQSYEYFRSFDRAVDHFLIRIRIAKARKRTSETVYLTFSEKSKIRHYITLIKELIVSSNLDVDKKEHLYDILANLENEVDRDRTRIKALTTTAMVVANALKNFEEVGVRPYYKYLMAIFGIAGDALENEKKSLPKPKEKRRLEPPKVQEPEYQLDDDIPF